MISEGCLSSREAGITCRLARCGSNRTQHIYGFYDVRLHDIFYVGSTFYPAKRFSDHMKGAKKPYNTKSLWLRSILESGSYPLPLLLYEFQTTCDGYTRDVEMNIGGLQRFAQKWAI